MADKKPAIGTMRKLIPGWRVFECDVCGALFEEASRDCLSLSGDTCECGEWLAPIGHREAPHLPVNSDGNLTGSYTRVRLGGSAALGKTQTSSDAACAPHADKSSCRPDAPPDVTQPDNGLATSGRGPETSVEELPTQPKGNTMPAVWGYDIVDKLADHTAVTMFDVDAAREEIIKLRAEIARLRLTDAEQAAIEEGARALYRFMMDDSAATLRGLHARAAREATP